VKLNRRKFIKAALAAATVAHVPLTVKEAEAAYAEFSAGIVDVGNGWYRIHMNYSSDDYLFDGHDVTFSAYAKAGTSSHIQMQHGKIRQWFDLETGELGSVEVVECDSTLVVGISGTDNDNVWIYGTQVEVTP
jgi:hypothetical protein